jgi:hypothetical protein
MRNFIGRAVIIHQMLDHGNEPTCSGANAYVLKLRMLYHRMF